MVCMAKYLNWYCQEHIIPAGEGWKQLLLIKQPELAAGKWEISKEKPKLIKVKNFI